MSGCLTFWQQFGFRVFREYAADEETSAYDGVEKDIPCIWELRRNDLFLQGI
jgi:hypothetical protein